MGAKQKTEIFVTLHKQIGGASAMFILHVVLKKQPFPLISTETQ